MINSKTMGQETEPDKARILVVDDNTINLRIITDLIEVMGYDSLMAENGLYALSTLVTCSPKADPFVKLV